MLPKVLQTAINLGGHYHIFYGRTDGMPRDRNVLGGLCGGSTAQKKTTCKEEPLYSCTALHCTILYCAVYCMLYLLLTDDRERGGGA